MPRYPCLVCGTPAEGSYCPTHEREQNQDIRNSRAWRKLSEAVRAREPHCRDCRNEGKLRLATQVHHAKPRGEGGPLLPPIEELVPLCIGHHNKRRKAGEILSRFPSGCPQPRADRCCVLSHSRGLCEAAKQAQSKPDLPASWPRIA